MLGGAGRSRAIQTQTGQTKPLENRAPALKFPPTNLLVARLLIAIPVRLANSMRLVLEKSYFSIGHHGRKVGIGCSVRYSTNPKLPEPIYIQKTTEGTVDMLALTLTQIMQVLQQGFGNASGGHCECGRQRPTSAHITLPSTGVCSRCTISLMASDALPNIPETRQTMEMVFDMVLATSTPVIFQKCYDSIGPEGTLLEQQSLEITCLNAMGVKPGLAGKRLGQLCVAVHMQRFSKDGNKRKAVGIRGNNLSREQASETDLSSYKPSCRRVTLYRSVVGRQDFDITVAVAVDTCYRLRQYGLCVCVGADDAAEYVKLAIPSTGVCWRCSLRQFLNAS